jgi:hypothetical protein
MTNVRLVTLLMLAVMIALFLAGGHHYHSGGFSDGGYW